MAAWLRPKTVKGQKRRTSVCVILTAPILAEVPGLVRLVDVIEGETMRGDEERKGQKEDRSLSNIKAISIRRSSLRTPKVKSSDVLSAGQGAN
jgi:hypothetical protein